MMLGVTSESACSSKRRLRVARDDLGNGKTGMIERNRQKSCQAAGSDDGHARLRIDRFFDLFFDLLFYLRILGHWLPAPLC